ncbi:MAG: MFS transporter [Haloarculaceae archaeon]
MRDRRLGTLGVLLGIFLAAVDGTIVSTAMPTVVGSLGGLEYYAWAFAAYMLFAAVSMPLYGRLADIYGRNRLFYIGVGAFVAGSVLAGLSVSMLQLVAFRALQGVGAGAMFAIPYTILGAIHPPEKRGWAIGLGSSVWGIASVLGPVLGWAIVATLGWRWVFFLSVPVGLVAVLLVRVALPETVGDADVGVDLRGASVLVAAVGTLLVGLQLLEAGHGLAPVLVTAGVVGLPVFWLVERRARDPLLPLGLFRDRVFVASNAAAFLSAFALFAALTYVPLYVQTVQGSPGSAALAVFPISLGWSGTSMLSGRVLNRVGERQLATAGTTLLVLSFAAAAAFWSVGTRMPLLLANVFLMGVGMGSLTPPLLTAIQNHLGDDRMGLATSSQQFFRNIGGTMGVSVLGVAMNLVLSDRLATVPEIDTVGDLQRLLLGGAVLPDGVPAIMLAGLTVVFVVGAAVSVVAVAAAIFLPEFSARDGAAAAEG